jgi:hypothetical protein
LVFFHNETYSKKKLTKKNSKITDISKTNYTRTKLSILAANQPATIILLILNPSSNVGKIEWFYKLQHEVIEYSIQY